MVVETNLKIKLCICGCNFVVIALAVKEKNELSTEEDEEDSNEKRETNVYNKYLHSVGGQYESEHDLYTRARNDLANVHKDKMSKVYNSV